MARKYNQPLLQLVNVSKIYQMDGLAVKAIDNVSLEIQKGEFVSLIGPSGSGKSTLMHLMGCLDLPTQGKIILDGQDISKMSEVELAQIRNQKIGFVFQTFNLLPRTAALANVELPLIYTRIDNRQEERKRAKKLLSQLGLAARFNHFPSQLSGGEQQRVAIARALINQPAIIFADEPTGNLDSKSGREVMKIFQNLHREGHTLVLVTHEKALANFAERIIKIRDGKISQ